MMKDCHRKCLHDLLPSTMSSCHSTSPPQLRTVVKSPSQIIAFFLLTKMSPSAHLLKLRRGWQTLISVFSRPHKEGNKDAQQNGPACGSGGQKIAFLGTATDSGLKALLVLKMQLDVEEDKHQILMMFSF